MKNEDMKANTKCVHSGNYVDEKALGINTPIFASTAFIFPNTFDEVRYPRYSNIPTQKAVAQKLCALEGGERAMVFSSGMAAITTVLFSLLKAGDHAIFQSGLYGGTQRFINTELERYGIQKDVIPSNEIGAYASAIKDDTVLIFMESPTNPLMDIIDLKGIAELAQEHEVLTVVDNTFASPINQNPLKLGIDIVIHSGTKYLNGHSDVLCGAVVTSETIMDKVILFAKNHGGSLGPQLCYLLERGLKTLGLRIAEQNKNAKNIAEFLNEQPIITRVYYPGLASHPNHELAKKQMRGFGGMLSFELACDVNKAKEFIKTLKIITPAVSLGGVESILCFPAETSHAELSQSERQKQGISDTLIRLSVGIEDVEDLIEDIRNALSIIT